MLCERTADTLDLLHTLASSSPRTRGCACFLVAQPNDKRTGTQFGQSVAIDDDTGTAVVGSILQVGDAQYRGGGYEGGKVAVLCKWSAPTPHLTVV